MLLINHRLISRESKLFTKKKSGQEMKIEQSKKKICAAAKVVSSMP